MDKIKKNAGLKCAVGIVLAVSLAAMLVSGLLAEIFFREDVYIPGGKEQIRNDIIEDIAEDYCHDIASYYGHMLRVDADIETENIAYDERFNRSFSEENCNMAFTAEVVGLEKTVKGKKYNTLSNYDCSEYQFTNSTSSLITLDSLDVMFEFDITPEEICNNLGIPYRRYEDEEEEFEDYYYDGVYTEYESNSFYIEEYDGSHYILDSENEIRYRLEDNTEFVEKYEKFIEKLNKEYNQWSEYQYYYDEAKGRFGIGIEASNNVEVMITYYVKSDLTAHDNFYSSFLLAHIDFAVDAAVPVLIVSAVLVIMCGVYLTLSAGHIKGVDGLSLNRFDRIPYDIVMAAFGTVVLILVNFMRDFFYEYEYCSTADFLTGITILAGVCLLLLPPVYYTTVARIKVGGIFRNTVIWRVLVWLGRILRITCMKASGMIKYLWNNLNIYWKYLGVFCLAVLIELFFVAQFSYSGAGFFVCIIVNAVFAYIMVVALINMSKLKRGAQEIAGGNTDYEINTEHMLCEFKKHGENLNSIKDGIQAAVEERMKSERMKTELITNVSHDIKTPLTSIISYVDLLSKEKIDSEKALEYIDVLERQSARLKKLIQDLIDASKASTGNMPVNLSNMDVKVLLEQALGEFSEKLDKRGLKPVVSYRTDDTMVVADGKLLWRTFDNLINNIVKYAQDNTRVYIDLENEIIGVDDNAGYVKKNSMIKVTFKNISKEELNMSGDELMERFVRGDSSRNTEGSGLGLSIAKSLMDIQNGKLEIMVDGDLFKVVLLLMRA